MPLTLLISLIAVTPNLVSGPFGFHNRQIWRQRS